MSTANALTIDVSRNGPHPESVARADQHPWRHSEAPQSSGAHGKIAACKAPSEQLETIRVVSGTGGEGTAARPVKSGATDASAQAEELELYKLAVEMADRVSARRALANTFFLTVNTGLAALLGGNNLRWYVAVAGIVFAVAWWWLLQSYRKLNWAKFEVINAIESRLPVQLFLR